MKEILYNLYLQVLELLFDALRVFTNTLVIPNTDTIFTAIIVCFIMLAIDLLCEYGFNIATFSDWQAIAAGLICLIILYIVSCVNESTVKRISKTLKDTFNNIKLKGKVSRNGR